MTKTKRSNAARHQDLIEMRELADQALSRAAGAPLLEGNAVELLKDAAENYPGGWKRSQRPSAMFISKATSFTRTKKAGSLPRR